MDTKITKDLAFPFIACPAATFFADFVQFQGENHPQAGSGVIFTADSYSFFMEPRPKIFGKVEVGFGGPSMGSYPSILSFPQPRPQAIKRCQWLVTMSTWSPTCGVMHGTRLLCMVRFSFFRKIDEANWCMVQSCVSYPSLEETSFALRRPCLWEVCTGNFSSNHFGDVNHSRGYLFDGCLQWLRLRVVLRAASTSPGWSGNCGCSHQPQVPVLGHLMSQIILTLRYGWAGVHLPSGKLT